MPSSLFALGVVLVALACSVAALRVSMHAAARSNIERDRQCSIIPRVDGLTLQIPTGRDSVASADDEHLPRVGQSVGAPGAGRLTGGTPMPAGPGYTLRHPDRVWGTASTVAFVRAAITHVHTRFPDLHALAIGDLSAKRGGALSSHFSHQSGRDIDLGLFFVRPPTGYPERFVRATDGDFHFDATWALIEALIETNAHPDGVSWMLLDYHVQRILYRHLQNAGVDPDKLSRVFQYPKGINADTGLVRHYPGHENHLHVRFRCPATDPFCTPAAGPWKTNRAQHSTGRALAAAIDLATQDE